MSLRRPVLATILSLAVAALAAGEASAQKKGKRGAGAKITPACGITYLPLVPGRSWTYESTASPNALSEQEAEEIKKLQAWAPPAPDTVTIKVLEVVPQGAGAEIKLEETMGKQTLTTTLHCTKTSLKLDPQSFLFAAEPGGGLLMSLSDEQRTGPSFPGAKGWRKGDKGKTEIKAKLTRKATEKSKATVTGGKVEIERTFAYKGKDPVGVTGKFFAKAFRVEFELEGRVAIEPNLEKAFEIPLGHKGALWFESGVGLIQAKNRVGQWFVLKVPKPAEK